MSKTKDEPSQNTSMYPHLEAFAETAIVEEIVGVFGPLKESLSFVKGPNSQKAEKASVAVAHCEEVLRYLLEVRSRLQSSTRGGK